jgi:hypothetical protein
MKRPVALAGLIVLILLIAAISRLIPHAENFAPLTAIAVFAGVRFISGRAALLSSLAILFLKDLILEGLNRSGLNDSWGFVQGLWVTNAAVTPPASVPIWKWPGFYESMWGTYAALVLIVLMSRLARGSRSTLVLATTTLAGSCIFFVVTNFACWLADYPRTLAGFLECYTLAIPFFGNSLVGDCTFACALFGAWALAEARLPALRLAPALVVS